MFWTIKKCRIFAPRLSDGVMAALQILVLPVQVRVLVGQPRKLRVRTAGDISPLFFYIVAND